MDEKFVSPCQYCARRFDCSITCGTFKSWFLEAWNEMCPILRAKWGLVLEDKKNRK